MKNFIKKLFGIEDSYIDTDLEMFKEMLALTPKTNQLNIYQFYLWLRLQQDKYMFLENALKKNTFNINVSDTFSLSHLFLGDETKELKDILTITNPKLKDQEVEEIVSKIVGILKTRVKSQ